MSAVPPFNPERARDLLAELENSGANAISKELPLPESPNKTITKIHYFLCNELGQDRILQALSSTRAPENGIHLGFSGLFNLDIIAARHSNFAILCDIDPNMLAALELVKHTLFMAESLADFQSLLWDKLQEVELVGHCLQAGNNQIRTKEEFIAYTSQKGWLSSEDSFKWIRMLYKEEKILHRQLDITDGEAFEKITNWALNQGFVFDTIYDSNILDWLTSRRETATRAENLTLLINPSTYVISAWKEAPLRRMNPALYYDQGKLVSQKKSSSSKSKKKRKVVFSASHQPKRAPRALFSDTAKKDRP